MRHQLAIGLAALACLLPSACGDEDSDSSQKDSKRVFGAGQFDNGELPYTGDQVFKLFYSHGLYLTRGERWDRIGLNSVATPQQRDAVLAEYGYFFVSIAKESGAIDTLLSDPSTGERLQPDPNGIHWYLEPGIAGIDPTWFALKRYGNVVAAWAAGGEKRTDGHWDNLTAVLDRLP